MKMYKVYTQNSMGFELDTKYYLDENKAWIEYNRTLEELRKDEHILSNEDCQEHYGCDNFHEEDIPKHLQDKIIKIANVWVWEDLGTDCGIEHDPTKIDVCLERIQVIE